MSLANDLLAHECEHCGESPATWYRFSQEYLCPDCRADVQLGERGGREP